MRDSLGKNVSAGMVDAVTDEQEMITAQRTMHYRCGLRPALDLIGGKWRPLILWELSMRSLRFGELRRLVIGISEKVLMQDLRELELNGVISRKEWEERPPRVEYSLSEYGESLYEALVPLCDWGERHQERLSPS
jgi:DNA-binding HxlR family transcriptional regulator